MISSTAIRLEVAWLSGGVVQLGRASALQTPAIGRCGTFSRCMPQANAPLEMLAVLKSPFAIDAQDVGAESVASAQNCPMQLTSYRFKQTARAKLADANLQAALNKLQTNFVKGRADRVAELDNFEAIRDAAAAIRDRALAHLDVYLAEFERNATAHGTVVHWAETTADVNRIVCELAARYGVRKAIKSKSMVSEECALNDALEAAGIEVVETDLGEYILQLAKEPPSHIVAPVVHKTRDAGVRSLRSAARPTAHDGHRRAVPRSARGAAAAFSVGATWASPAPTSSSPRPARR